MFDPKNLEDLSRLRRSIKSSMKKLDKYDDNRKLLQDSLHDPCHQAEPVETEKRSPVNSLDDAVTILTRGVVDQNPTLRIVRTKRPNMAGMLKTKLEKWAAQVDLSGTLQGAYHECLMRWGIVFMGYDMDERGVVIPFAKTLDFDDYFIDMVGSDEDDIDFEGHRYCVRYDELLDPSTGYIQENVEKIGRYKSSRRKGGYVQDALYDRVELIYVYLPKDRLVLVLPHENCGVTEPIHIVDYQGPPWGPYLRLDLGKVRGAMVPTSRLSMWYDTHEFELRAYRHVFSQADRQLQAWGYSGENKKDADKHRTLADDEYVGFEGGKDAVWPINKGGVNTQTLAAAIHASNKFNERAGNIKLAGGLAATAPTARQEAGLGVGVTQMIADSRNRMQKLTKRIYETAAWYFLRDRELRADPEIVEWQAPSGLKYPSKWQPWLWDDVDPGDPEMEIIPGSMVSRTAEAQLAFLTQQTQNIGGLMVLPGSEPQVFNLSLYKRLVSEYGNAPEIDQLFSSVPDASQVVPGVESAASVAQRPQSAPGGVKAATDGADRMMERMIFSGGQQAAQPANA